MSDSTIQTNVTLLIAHNLQGFIFSAMSTMSLPIIFTVACSHFI